MEIIHHGATNGVTGSCHQLFWNDNNDSILVDCGLFQGNDVSSDGASWEELKIDFDISTIHSLLITHCHIDHVGRIPYLMAAGFKGKIYCTIPTAKLLPIVLEDAVEIGFTKNAHLIKQFLNELNRLIVPVPCREWIVIPSNSPSAPPLNIRFKNAGHILGSAYIECKVGKYYKSEKVVFSGDLGAPYAPLLAAPKPVYSTDVLVLESTYGNRLHGGRRQRYKNLQKIVKRSFANRGAILIPAFSIGRTQELLYELEHIIHKFGKKNITFKLKWEDIDVIVDSPLAAKFTQIYGELRKHWDREAKRRIIRGRHPLSFEQMMTVDSHENHLRIVEYLKNSGRPAIVIAAGGMCSGGRIVNYLKSLVEDKRTDILFVGYQASGTPGRIIQKYGPNHGYVILDGRKYTINAEVHTISGYSAHADQASLLRFVRQMRFPPKQIRLVHGDHQAKTELQQKLHELYPSMEVLIPTQ